MSFPLWARRLFVFLDEWGFYGVLAWLAYNDEWPLFLVVFPVGALMVIYGYFGFWKIERDELEHRRRRAELIVTRLELELEREERKR